MTTRVVDDIEVAARLRQWVRDRFGVWITHNTAKSAVRLILGSKP